ncbi:hypothetical protein F2Q69_00030784 [Brassica cretica]|uniref:Uncharacterized protein n=1 Tax=Brassica cretica TaxID=69181 RepID=A0A8S9S4I6_BRACR|nr:hypothetical protein F2Q69_00030784 [Brassica cretica]
MLVSLVLSKMSTSSVSCGTSFTGENNELGISDWLITISVKLGHGAAKVPWAYDSLFSWSNIQFRLLELLHQRSNSMPLLEKGDLSILRVSRVRICVIRVSEAR